MLTKTMKAGLAAIVVATAAAATAVPANAGSAQLQIEVGSRHHGQLRRGPRHGPRYGHGPRYHRGVCTPREAVRKAWRIGMNRPGIRRIDNRRIVVTRPGAG